MNTFQVHIYHANSPFYEGECESLILPTTEGDYGIQANHSNLIAAVVPGTMMYRLPGQPAQYAAVSAGLVKVEDNDVLVLVDSASARRKSTRTAPSARWRRQRKRCCRKRPCRNTRWRRPTWPARSTACA